MAHHEWAFTRCGRTPRGGHRPAARLLTVGEAPEADRGGCDCADGALIGSTSAPQASTRTIPAWGWTPNSLGASSQAPGPAGQRHRGSRGLGTAPQPIRPAGSLGREADPATDSRGHRETSAAASAELPQPRPAESPLCMNDLVRLPQLPQLPQGASPACANETTFRVVNIRVSI